MSAIKVRKQTKYFINTNDREFELAHQPDDGSLVVKILPNGYAVVGYLVQDEDCGNPLEDQDGIGHIYSLNKRHVNFDEKKIQEALGMDSCFEPNLELVDQAEVDRRFESKHDAVSNKQEALNAIALELWRQGRTAGTIGDTDAVPLSYFEHGLCLWDVAGGERISRCPDMRWDGTGFAGLWVPDDCVKDSYTGQDGKSRGEWMREQAAAACEQYTDWCNGECFGVVTQVFDKDNHPVAAADACWGHIGREYAEKERNDCVAGESKDAAKL